MNMKILSMFFIGIIVVGFVMAVRKILKSRSSKKLHEKDIFHFKAVPEDNTETQRDLE